MCVCGLLKIWGTAIRGRAEQFDGVLSVAEDEGETPIKTGNSSFGIFVVVGMTAVSPAVVLFLTKKEYTRLTT